jgi:raffinose/stachyose/melibiose transport system substrate-binding protein
MRNATKRALSGIAVSLLTASALVGFSSSAQAATEANTITFSAPKPGGGTASPYKAIADAFNAKYPNYNVVLTEVDTAVYTTNLQTQLRAGNAPDVFKVQPGAGQIDSLLPFIKAKLVADLTSTAAKTSNPKGMASQLGIAGKTYAVAIDQTAGGMIYNKTVMEKDGFEWPTDFNTMIEICKGARAKGKTLFGLAGSMYANNGLMVMGMAGASVYATGDSWNEKRIAGKVTFANSPEWKAVMNNIVKMKNAGCFQDGAAAGGFVDAIDNRFFTGKSYAVFVPGGTSVSFSNLPFLKGQEIKTMVFPGSKRLAVSNNYALAVNAKTTKLAVAKAFINFAATTEAQTAGQTASGNLPIKDINPATLKVQYSGVGSYMKKGMTYAFPNQAWEAPEVYVKLGTGVQGLLTGQATVAQVLKSVDAAWK